MLAAAGFCGISGQITLLRRLEVLFGGNELSLAVFFACWMVWSGAGAFAGRYLKRTRLPALLILQGLSFPLSIWAIRSWNVVTGREIGLISGIPDILMGSFILTGPIALLTGVIFTCGIKYSDGSPGRVYFWEAGGAVAGGIFASFMLGYMNPFQIGFIGAGLNIFVANTGKKVQIITAAITLIFILFAAPIVERISIDRIYNNLELIESTESVYGEIAVVRNSEQYAVFLNGMISASFPDKFSSEEAVHFPMLVHDNPREILLIGGGFSGAVDEILKYSSVKTAYYAEIDGELIDIVQRNFPDPAVKFVNDDRVEIIIEDGRRWLKHKRDMFDVVIVNLPDPGTALLNRYYTQEFFREAKKSLKSDGIIGITIDASDDFIGESLAELLSGINSTINTIFEYSVMLPGSKCHFIAGQKSFAIDTDSLIGRLEQRGITSEYISKNYLPYRLSNEKRDYLEQQIKLNQPDWINSDFAPRGYLSVLARWDKQFHPRFNFGFSGGISIFMIISAILLVSLIFVVIMRGTILERGVRLGLLTGGFSQIGLQLMLLMGFQFIYGYVYYKQAILITVFMAGTAVGSYSGSKWEKFEFSGRIKAMIKIQTAMILLPAAVYILLNIAGSTVEMFNHILTFGAFLCGCSAGLQYTVGAACLSGNSAKSGGGLYGLDLLGSSGGALITGIILIPVLGFRDTALLLGIISVLPLLMIYFRKFRFSN